jgi:(+)-trans-carveol dehydrogenase
MGRLDGKVAFITGAARGQGRGHAVRLAQEGADIIAVDICSQIDTVDYSMSSAADLAETASRVEALDRRIITGQADVRDYNALKSTLDAAVARLGRLDIVSANAGIFSLSPLETMGESTWQDVIDVNLTGVWHTAKAAIPHLRAAGGGSIVFTASTSAVKAKLASGHYGSAKHGLIGLMRTLALELANDLIRVNSVLPTTVDTDMIMHEAMFARFAPDLLPEERTLDALIPRFASLNAMPLPWVDVIDISNAVLFLASDEARYITGVALPVDLGSTIL